MMAAYERRHMPVKTPLTYFVASLLVVTLTLAATVILGSNDPGEQIEVLLSELESHRADWIRKKPRKYRYTVVHSNGGSGPVPREYRVDVAGASKIYRYTDTNERSLDAIPDDPVFIETVFERAKMYLTDGYPASRLLVSLDKEYGFPTQAVFDFDCADCGETIEIREFQVLE